MDIPLHLASENRQEEARIMTGAARKAAEQRSPAEIAELRSHAAEAAGLLKALASENRLLIVCTLAQGEMSVGELNDRVDLSQSGLSQQLAVLRREGLVKTRRESQTIFYSLTDSHATRVIELLHDLYCAPPDKSGSPG